MRLPTLLLIYLLLSLGWLAVSARLEDRHYSQDQNLRRAVAKLWGTIHRQQAPTLDKRTVFDSDISVDLDLDYRKKGMFWYSTYTVGFEGSYRVKPGPQADIFSFALPAHDGMYSNFEVLVDEQPVEYELSNGAVCVPVSQGEQVVRIRYQGQGSEQWWYNFATAAQASTGFRLILRTNFSEIDFPDGSISPTTKQSEGEGWKLTWDYRKVLRGGEVGITLPRKGNPGPILVDMCLAAPLGLLGFMVVLATFTVVYEGGLRETHFALLGVGYFCFHLLFVYLGDHMSLGLAFLISALTALFVNLSYVRKVSTDGFAFRRALPALTLYLVLFSSAFLKPGMRGLPLVALAILTLHILMQVTASYNVELPKPGREQPDPNI